MKFSLGFEIVVGLIAILLLAPIVVVVLVSFSADGNFAFPPRSWSLHWFEEFFRSELFVQSFLFSLMIGALTAVLATLLGGMAAVALVRLGIRTRPAAEMFFLTPLLVPHILLGAALLLFYLNSDYRGTFVPLLIGHVIIALPYAVQTVLSGLSGLGTSLEQAAMSLGATPLQAFFKVTLPLIRSSLFSAGIFAFVISFSDINLAIFLTGPRTTTLPAVIFSDIVQLGQPTVAAASTLQIALILAFLLIFRRSIEKRVLR